MDIDFGVPEDVAQRLMNEAEFEASAGGEEPFAMDVLAVFNRKVVEYRAGLERTVH